jgi:type III secretion system FlhB-like substrate exporter
MDVGENIPPSLYEVVAQILIFIDDLDKLAERQKKERAAYERNE